MRTMAAATQHITLSQLQERIKATICTEFNTPVWITAEISEIKVNSRSGHCYMQLVEKGGKNGVPRAQASAVIWAGRYGMLSAFFTGATGRQLEAGMNVLIAVTVSYHELYGLSLNVSDIDPLYTLGEMEQQRLQTIAQLHEDGVFDLNREIELPDVIQRIAIISSPQAAGYQDFINELHSSRYSFHTELFGAFMQGHGAETSIIKALEAVAERTEEFDAVVLIRGGGSQSDLGFLNSYLLCSHIAQFPLPVISGLGHDKDHSVADMVAAISLKTPTAVATFIADRADTFYNRLEDLAAELHVTATRILDSSTDRLASIWQLLHERIGTACSHARWQLRSLTDNMAAYAKHATSIQASRLHGYKAILSERAVHVMATARNRIERAASLTAAVDPQTILARGFAIVRTDGHAITDADTAVNGTMLDITLNKGKLKAKVTGHGK